VAQERREGKRVAVGHEVQAPKRVAQQMRMQTLHTDLPTDAYADVNVHVYFPGTCSSEFSSCASVAIIAV
jgi:hypothetical protein